MELTCLYSVKNAVVFISPPPDSRYWSVLFMSQAEEHPLLLQRNPGGAHLARLHCPLSDGQKHLVLCGEPLLQVPLLLQSFLHHEIMRLGEAARCEGGEMFAVVPRRLCSGLQSRIKRNIDGATWPSPQLSKCYISPLYLAFHSKTQGMDLFCSTTLRLTCGGPHLHSAHFWWVRPPLESTATRLSACYKELCIGWCESPQLVM